MSIEQQMAIVRERYRVAHAALNKSEHDEVALLQAECEKIGHKWKYHQVAGNGRFCILCDASDIGDD